MKKESDINQRIPFCVESPRGDDRIGTNQETGALITDHAAKESGVPFQPGVPQERVQEAVEAQLKDEKWVVLEKKDGSSELLTRKDIPEPEKEKEENVPEEKPGEEKKTGDVEGAGAGEDDWRKVFSAVPAKPKPEPKSEEPAVKPAVNPTVNPTVKPACTAGPKKEKESWKSKFENITSATATHKGKGG